MSSGAPYPEITHGIGELTPSMWNRWMQVLRSYEEGQGVGDSTATSIQDLNDRVLGLENQTPYFFAKLLRAHVLDHNLQNPNVYEYAWVEVSKKSQPPDCCPPCIESRHWANDNWYQPLCCNDPNNTDCLTYLNFQGHWNWWEETFNTSWGDTLPETGFVTGTSTSDLQSPFNPDGYPCILNYCNPDGGGDYPDRFTQPYTKPAMNILESFNTFDNAGGVDQTKGIGDFMLQAMGGGDTQRDHTLGYEDSWSTLQIPECWDSDIGEPPCTQYEFPLKTTPIVLMFNIRESDGTFRQVFQAANSYDGTCVAC
jgi:hypothetical protein